MTLYNDPLFTYNAPINYNGVVVPPVPPPVVSGVGGLWDFREQPILAFPKREEEEAIALILTQILVDED